MRHTRNQLSLVALTSGLVRRMRCGLLRVRHPLTLSTPSPDQSLRLLLSIAHVPIIRLYGTK